jgi:hypothetical protein
MRQFDAPKLKLNALAESRDKRRHADWWKPGMTTAHGAVERRVPLCTLAQ